MPGEKNNAANIVAGTSVTAQCNTSIRKGIAPSSDRNDFAIVNMIAKLKPRYISRILLK